MFFLFYSLDYLFFSISCNFFLYNTFVCLLLECFSLKVIIYPSLLLTWHTNFDLYFCLLLCSKLGFSIRLNSWNLLFFIFGIGGTNFWERGWSAINRWSKDSIGLLLDTCYNLQFCIVLHSLIALTLIVLFCRAAFWMLLLGNSVLSNGRFPRLLESIYDSMSCLTIASL